MKVMLVAALMGAGASAWATDYYSTSTTDGVTTTEMYFNQYIVAAVDRTKSQAFVLSSNSATTTDSKTVYAVNDITGTNNLYMFNYIAMADAYVMRRASTSSSVTTTSTYDGIYTVSTQQYISIINLHAGDKVTVYHSGAVYFRSTNVTTSVSAGDAMTSGTEYTIASGTQLDLYHYIKSKNHYIGCIKIVSNYDAVSDPVLTQTAAGSTSTIQITAGKCTNSGSTVTTYYTTDGTTPSAENNEGSFTTSTYDVNITSDKTIKAISVTSGTYGGSSYVVSGDFTTEEATLAAPTATVTGFTKSGDYYYPIYTFSSDQSGTIGYDDEELTYTYSFNSADPVTATTYQATATAGTLRVTVSADGFQSNYTDVVIAGTQYVSTYYFDGSKIYDHATTGSSDYSVNGAGCHHYTLTGTYINGLTVSGLYHAWAITNNVSSGLSGRTGSGSVTYTGDFPSGSYTYAYKVGNKAGSGAWSVSSSATVSVAHYNALTSLRVLVPSASATVYSIASGTNLTNNGEFTSNVSGWNTVGTITKDSDSSTSGTGFWWNGSGFAEMWASNDSGSDDYAYYNSDCYIAQRYVNMPAGDYYVSADLVANGGNVSVYTISVNGVAQETDNGPYESFTTKAHVINVPNDNSTITIKYAPQTNGRAWVGIDNVSCIYDPNPSVTVTDAGFATYVNSSYDLDFSSTTIEAYKVKVSTKGVATLTKVNQVPAGTPVLLYAEGGEIENIPVTTGAAAVSDNDLVAGTGAAVATSQTIDEVDYTNMILNNVESKIGFYFANGQTVATNRAYLHIASTLAPNAAASRMVMVFGDETTGIAAMRSEMQEGTFYNLQGQRVDTPKKGLYIVNGKKVIIK